MPRSPRRLLQLWPKLTRPVSDPREADRAHGLGAARVDRVPGAFVPTDVFGADDTTGINNNNINFVMEYPVRITATDVG
jgi:hypothetical protein